MGRRGREERGFTLIELSIVLVIIGLIVGGVVMGQDLINAASMRTIVSTIESLNAAANTFRNKYDTLPGTEHNFFPAWGAAGSCPANAHGPITMPYTYIAGSLPEYFHSQLSAAGLSQYGSVSVGVTGAPDTIGTTFPDIGTANNGMLLVSTEQCQLNAADYGGTNGCPASNGSTHYFWLTGSATNYFQFTINLSPMPTLTPQQANSIDQKIDDGNPLTGGVLARGGTAGGNNYLFLPYVSPPGCGVGQPGWIPLTGTSGQCVSSAAGNPYLTSDHTPQCILSVRSTF